MKKGSIVITIILILCIIFAIIKIERLNSTVEALDSVISNMESNYNTLLRAVNRNIIFSVPLTTEEAETFCHNINILNELYGRESMRSVEIANQCFSLKRNSDMESAWIENVIEHTNHINYYRIEIVTDDGEHYWFEFDYDSSFVYAIHKGENRETLLFGIVE